MQGVLKWLAIVIALVAVLALAGWMFPEFGTMLAAAGSVVVIALIFWVWMTNS
jgi:drug/metabolite transporter superfamily protein YnfA